MNLYVIRHAIAVDLGSMPEVGDPPTPRLMDDSQRPLTQKGRKKMQAIARGLIELEVSLDLILASPYVRARETAEILAEAFDMKDRLFISENLTPASNPGKLIDEIIEKHEVGSLAVVGHEPFLSSMISTLLAGNADLMVNMKKGGVCCLAIDDLRHERPAELEWLLTPAQLARLGGQLLD